MYQILESTEGPVLAEQALISPCTYCINRLNGSGFCHCILGDPQYWRRYPVWVTTTTTVPTWYYIPTATTVTVGEGSWAKSL